MTKQTLWVADDGSWGSGNFDTFDTSTWDDVDWEHFENARDWERLHVAYSIDKEKSND
jgi:hypothetical protein